MVVIQRDLSYVLREGRSQFSTRRNISEYYITNRVGCFTASEPYIQYSREIFLFPSHHSAATCKIDQYNRFACLFQCCQKITLRIRHFKISTAAGFTTHFRRFTNCRHNHIRLGSYTQSLIKQFLRTTRITHFTTEHGSFRLSLSIIHQI